MLRGINLRFISFICIVIWIRTSSSDYPRNRPMSDMYSINAPINSCFTTYPLTFQYTEPYCLCLYHHCRTFRYACKLQYPTTKELMDRNYSYIIHCILYYQAINNLSIVLMNNHQFSRYFCLTALYWTPRVNNCSI